VILAFRALGLGDLLTVVPAVRALRRAAAGEELVLAVPPALIPLAAKAHLADRCVPVASAVDAPPTTLGGVEESPRVAVNLHGAGPQSTLLLRRLRPDRLWAYGEAGAPPWDSEEHEVHRWRRLVEAYGCRTRSDDLYLGPTRPRTGPVLIHPGAAHPHRRWPAHRFADVAATLKRQGLPVRVSAGPGETDLAHAVASQAGLPADVVLSDLDLAVMADHVNDSRLVVCGDTGIAHLATAYHTASIVLFGPQPPSRWGPPPGGRHRILWRPRPDDATASPDLPHPSLRRIQVDDVLAMANELVCAR
jgi:hypothetical protein